MTNGETTSGVVVSWSDDEGWGSLRSADVPGDVFVHFSMIVDVAGHRSLTPGQHVRFTWERFPQDGFDFRAIEVFGGDGSVPEAAKSEAGSGDGAYASGLRISLDEETGSP
ncbi:CspA family cold shock protein [Streptosporangium becharense]|uniref:CspA family cold shock protein n=1 Tax=Streptosporangium becharense TaxID=1816182 RepID=A0A7W9MIC8_9ACTN|nr:cold shock domain-containing protein [Streptosporangium becharense]MBB2913941.1 CspA family cold shock protein [Streptosporangium becharense]MBB5821398.1 CspA family cold shock protein [Streptosporangium becharense]